MSETIYSPNSAYCRTCGRDTLFHICDDNCPPNCRDAKCLRAPHADSDEGCVFLCGVCGTPNEGGGCLLGVNLDIRATSPALALAGDSQRSLDSLKGQKDVMGLIGEIIFAFAQAEYNLWTLFSEDHRVNKKMKRPSWTGNLKELGELVDKGELVGELGEVSYEVLVSRLRHLNEQCWPVRNVLAHGHIESFSEETHIISFSGGGKTLPGRTVGYLLVNREKSIELTKEFLGPIAQSTREILDVVGQIQKLGLMLKNIRNDDSR